MRLFIAIEVDGFKDYFISLQEKIKTDIAKLTFPKSFHMTLKFLGDVPETKLGQIKEKLGRIEFNAFSFKFANIGVFPNENYIRVVWLGIDPEKEAVELQKKIDTALEGMFKRERDFVPHITLARVKFVKEKQEFSRLIKSLSVDGKPVKVSSFKLIKSTLTGEGPVYEEIAKFEVN